MIGAKIARVTRCVLPYLACGLATAVGVAGQPVEWPAVAGDAGNMRHSTLRQVDTRNVATLGAAWSVKLNAAGSSAAIVVREGRMYVTAGPAVFALEARSGKILWSHTPAAAPSTKGVAVGGGRVYVGLANSELVALDELTGKPLWSTPIGDPEWKGVQLGEPPAATLRKPSGLRDRTAGQRISAAPAYVDGKVVVGLANGDFGVRGRIACIDAATGRRLWQFFTIPGPGEAGHDSWPAGSEVWKTGGGGVWTTPAIDARLGLMYVGVGDPAPQWGGEVRAGDNLYTSSVVALELRTGKLAWHFQAVHHDVWDSDLGTPLILFDKQVGGRKRPAIAVMRTDGYLFQLDRRTGKPLQPIVERPVPHDATQHMSATQPFPVDAEPVGPRCVEADMVPAGFQRKCFFEPYGNDENLMFPFNVARAAPMSFDPARGYFFLAGGIGPLWVQRSEDPYYYGFAVGAPGVRNYGLIAAVDVRTSRVAWQKRMPYRIERGSGTTSTAGGLVLHGGPDGQLLALDGRDGALLWSFQTGAPINGPVSTYEVDGEQYIAVAAGELWAFKLGGQLPPRAAPPPPPVIGEFKGPTTRTRSIELGTTVFDAGLTGDHARFSDTAFHPVRTRVDLGATVTWTNKGRRTQTIEAQDGSWTLGPLAPGESRSLVVSRAGRQVFTSREHPWSTAELIVSDRPVNPQAQRGERLYQTQCAACHRDDLTGLEPAPPLAGRQFLSKWTGRTVAELAELVRSSMPPGRPDSLGAQGTLDVVEFLLDTNEVDAGGAELAPGSSRLGARIEAGAP